MSKKKTVLLAGLLGAGVLTASVQYYRKLQEERQKSQALQQVREFFIEFGNIATVYVDETQSHSCVLTGGVVLEDGRVFLFENSKGMISYQEEEV